MNFKTWKFNGVQFLAVPRLGQNDWHVVDENGGNYGSWYDAEHFRKEQIAKKPAAEKIETNLKAIPYIRLI